MGYYPRREIVEGGDSGRGEEINRIKVELK